MDSTTSSLPHWHLLLNHFPAVGVVIGLGLLLCGVYLNSADLTRASLALFVIMGLVAIPTYITGSAAGWLLRDRPGISVNSITAHEDAALFALTGLLITGWVSWFALWQYQRFSRPYRWSVPAALVLATFTLLLMVRTGTLGGYINHPEILSGQAAQGSEVPGRTAALAAWVVDSPVTWPTLEAVHFLGMSILFGVVLLMVTRVFGIGRSVPFAAIHRLLPLGSFGFMMNVASGMLFFIADSERYSAMTTGFFPKIGLIVIGGTALLFFTLFDQTWNLKPGEEAPMLAKIVAAATVLVWSGVIIYGRLLPYLEGG